MKTSDILIGSALVFFGTFYLLENFNILPFKAALIWPLVFIASGLGYWVNFYKDRKKFGYTLPGTIFTIYGLIFFICTLTSWSNMVFLWPGFLIGPGLGFYFYYFFGKRNKGLLVPTAILGGLGIIFLFAASGIFLLLPVLLIIAGLYFIFKDKIRKKGNSL